MRRGPEGCQGIAGLRVGGQHHRHLPKWLHETRGRRPILVSEALHHVRLVGWPIVLIRRHRRLLEETVVCDLWLVNKP